MREIKLPYFNDPVVDMIKDSIQFNGNFCHNLTTEGVNKLKEFLCIK